MSLGCGLDIKKAYKFVIVKHSTGVFQEDDVKLVEEDLPLLKDGEYFVEAHFISIDPYTQLLIQNPKLFPIGSTVPAAQIARVYDSKNPDFRIGCYVYGNYGWRSHTIGPIKNEYQIGLPDQIPLPYDDIFESYFIGLLGMPGLAAYKGVLDICKPKKGETVVVSAAAGGVGSLAAQIAKMQGSKVIGITGSDEKGKWLIESIGLDGFINYKKPDLAKKLKEAAPEGIDCYFDNVGGEISSTVISQINPFGRIAVCGAVSIYQSDPNDLPKASVIQKDIVLKQLKMEGFQVSRWRDEWFTVMKEIVSWLKEGKIKCREYVVKGFHNTPKALVDVMTGANTGKTIVQVLMVQMLTIQD